MIEEIIFTFRRWWRGGSGWGGWLLLFWVVDARELLGKGGPAATVEERQEEGGSEEQVVGGHGQDEEERERQEDVRVGLPEVIAGLEGQVAEDAAAQAKEEDDMEPGEGAHQRGPRVEGRLGDQLDAEQVKRTCDEERGHQLRADLPGQELQAPDHAQGERGAMVEEQGQALDPAEPALEEGIQDVDHHVEGEVGRPELGIVGDVGLVGPVGDVQVLDDGDDAAAEQSALAVEQHDAAERHL